MLAITAIAAVLYALKGENILSDPDTYWHVATGQRIATSLSLPTADPFSHTAFGKEWILFEWLSQALFGAAYALGGWSAVAWLCLACAAGSVCLLARHLLRHLAGVHVLVICLLAVSLSMPHLLARPHVLAWPIMVLWTAALVRSVDDGARPPLWLVPVATLWANLHGSFVLGLGLAGLAALDAMAKAWNGGHRQAVLSAWTTFCGLLGAASLITPQGIDTFLHILSVQGQPVQMGAVAEWQASNFQQFQPLAVWLGLFLLAALTLGLRVPMVRTVAFVVLLFLALRHVRHVELVGFLAPILLAGALAKALALRSAAPVASLPIGPRILTAVAAACLLLVLGRAAVTRFAPARDISPAAALNALDAKTARGKVLNDYDFGGFLISRGVATFIDGRSDLFGDAFLSEYIKAAMVPAKPETLAKYLDAHEIGWTLFQPARPAVAALDTLPGWRRAYADDVAVVHVRDPPARPREGDRLPRCLSGERAKCD